MSPSVLRSENNYNIDMNEESQSVTRDNGLYKVLFTFKISIYFWQAQTSRECVNKNTEFPSSSENVQHLYEVLTSHVKMLKLTEICAGTQIR